MVGCGWGDFGEGGGVELLVGGVCEKCLGDFGGEGGMDLLIRGKGGE